MIALYGVGFFVGLLAAWFTHRGKDVDPYKEGPFGISAYDMNRYMLIAFFLLTAFENLVRVLRLM